MEYRNDQGHYVIPSLYLSNYMQQYEDYVRSYQVKEKNISKGEELTRYGIINNTAYYIKSGIMHLSLGHDKGYKSLNLFGNGTIFPVGVELHTSPIEYDMVLTAFTDLQVLCIPYPLLRKMVENNSDFGADLLRENCDFMGYVFFDTVNQTFEPCLCRVSDILYLYMVHMQSGTDQIFLSQTELASLAGASRPQLERSMKSRRVPHP